MHTQHFVRHPTIKNNKHAQQHQTCITTHKHNTIPAQVYAHSTTSHQTHIMLTHQHIPQKIQTVTTHTVGGETPQQPKHKQPLHNSSS